MADLVIKRFLVCSCGAYAAQVVASMAEPLSRCIACGGSMTTMAVRRDVTFEINFVAPEGVFEGLSRSLESADKRRSEGRK